MGYLQTGPFLDHLAVITNAKLATQQFSQSEKLQFWYKLFPFRDLDEKTLERKISLCREYLGVLDVIDAGISHNIGITAW